MKKSTLLVLLMVLIGILAADVYTIGDGTSTQNYVPFYGLYDYGWSKVIYTAAELSAAGLTPGEIDGIGFDVGNTASNYTMPDQRVYIRHTTADLYAAEDNTLPDNTSFQQVYNTEYTWNGTGWLYVMFSTPFVWDGTSNLEILWENWDGDWDSGYPNFRYTATTDIKAIYKYADSTFPADLTGSTTLNRPNIQIVTPSVNPPDAALLIAPADGGFAFANTTLSWSNGGGMPSSYNVYFGTTSTPAFVVNQAGTSYPVADLLPGTTYYWQIVPENSNGVATACPVWSFSIPAADQLAESFEESVPPTGWASLGTANWTRSTSQYTDGTASAYKYSSSTSQFTLSTPMLSIAAGNTLTFDIRISSATAMLEMLYSTDRENWTLLESITPTAANSWENHVIDLTAAAGNHYIGFRTGLQSASFYLDSVIGPEILPLAPGTPTLNTPADMAINQSAFPVLGWTAATTGGVPTSFNVYLDTNANPTTMLANTETTSYTVATALNYDTTYYWKVSAVNSMGESDASAIFSFTTMSNPTISSFPWTVDFGTASTDWPVLNWTQRSGLYPSPTGSTEQWLRDDWLNGTSGNNAAKINIYGTTRYGWLITPPINIPTGNYQLSFDAALMTWNQTTAPTTTQEDDRLLVIVSDSPDLSNPSILREYNNTGSQYAFNSIPAEGQNYSISLAGLTGVKYLAFYGESTVTGNGDNDLMVDNVSITEAAQENPIFAINPNSHNFGELNVGDTASQEFTITNAGQGTLIIHSIALSGSEMMNLGTLPTLPASITGTQSLTFSANYAPTAAGDHTATITINDNMVRIAHNISLSGSAIDVPTDLYPPRHLAALVDGNDVTLSWDAPEIPPTGEWLTWCNPDALGNGIGTNAAAIFDVAHRYDAADLAAYQGHTLTNIKFVPNEVNAVYTLKVWTGTSNTMPSTVVHSQTVVSPTIGAWNNLILTTPIPVPTTGQLWIGYNINTQGGFPAGCDDGPVLEGKGNMINMGGWSTLTALAATLTYNWSIQGYVDDFRALTPMPVGTPVLASAKAEGTLVKSGVSRNISRAHTGYNIYRDDALISSISDITTNSYTDSDLTLGTYAYSVTATYDNGESVPVGPISVAVEELLPPLDLAATVAGNDVSLSWTSPQPPLVGDWISWSDNSMLGNSIGTSTGSNFDVAHRYDATDLAPHIGGTLAMVKFAPMSAATYTVKIWTGGTATAPANLVHSQTVNNPTLEDWTSVILTNPIPITGEQLWIGYHVSSTGGFPAGCDNGPAVEGKGNVMKTNSWTTLSQLNAELIYNWQIQGLVVQNGTYKALTLSPIAETANPATSDSFKNARNASVKNDARGVLLGFKVYRDDALISTIGDPSITTLTDMNLPNDEYMYGVTAIYNNGESEPASLAVTVNMEIAPVIFEDSFETYEDFAITMAPWRLIDQDGSATYGIQNVSFPNSEAMMAFMAFNPSATVPPITDLVPYEGSKMAASFAAVTPPNSDWLITPRIALGDGSSVKFYAKSHTAAYGLERFRVGVSTYPTVQTQLFTYITGAEYVEAPTNWTEYHYDLSAYDQQSVFIAIRCVSDDAFVFYVDNFSVHSGPSANDDPSTPVAKTVLQGNYPNPFNPETTIRYSVKEPAPVTIEIFNLKGQLVKRLVNTEKAAGEHSVIWNGTDTNNSAVSSGVYFYRMNTGNYSSSKKMILMK